MKRSTIVLLLFLFLYKPAISQVKYAYVHYDSIYVSHPKIEVFQDSIVNMFYRYSNRGLKFCTQLDSLKKTKKKDFTPTELEVYQKKQRSLLDTLQYIRDEAAGHTLYLANTLPKLLEREVDSACMIIEKKSGVILLKLNDSLIALETRTKIDLTHEVIQCLNSKSGLKQDKKNRFHRNDNRSVTFNTLDCPAEYRED